MKKEQIWLYRPQLYREAQSCLDKVAQRVCRIYFPSTAPCLTSHHRLQVFHLEEVCNF